MVWFTRLGSGLVHEGRFRLPRGCTVHVRTIRTYTRSGQCKCWTLNWTVDWTHGLEFGGFGLTIDIIDYVNGIGNLSRDQYIRTRAHSSLVPRPHPLFNVARRKGEGLVREVTCKERLKRKISDRRP